MEIPTILQTISKALHAKGAKAILVGGSVRDHMMDKAVKDYDIEVFGLNNLEELETLLGEYGSVNLVGKSFGVLKFVHEGYEFDFSFPRSEIKVDKGHRGFDVSIDGSLPFKSAAKRRDFSVNALGYDIERKHFLDPFHALQDMDHKRLRHIDDETFVEDPLRVYRAVQFCARFGYELAEETMILCRHMVEAGMLEELPKERIYAEFVKLLLKSETPSMGFELIRKLGILRYFSELNALIGVKQSPKWHPEGDVWVHTMMTLDEMAHLLKERSDMDEKEKLKFFFAILCHDLGKATTTTIDDQGNVRAIGHEKAGLELTKTFMYRLTDEHDFIESLLPLVEHHLKPSQFYEGGAKAPAIRRLATKVNIEELIVVATADFLGRTTPEALSREFKAGKWLLKEASRLHVNSKPLECMIQGRDLIDLGLQPSKAFKNILDDVYDMQLEGYLESKEAALQYVKEKYLQGDSR